MKILETVGIDVSKLTIDVRIYSTKDYLQVENCEKGYKKMVKWVFKHTSFNENETFFAFEHTGLYSHNLGLFLHERGLAFNIVPGYEIRHSLGITRGKDDKIDAGKIARYAYRLRDEIEPYIMPIKEVAELKRLLSLRDRLVRDRAGYKASLGEYKRFLVQKESPMLFETLQKMIKYLDKQIDKIDQELMSIIKSNASLLQMFNLITSITSVGQQTALFMIVYTHAFTKFSSSRKFASYCGTAPFPNTSGTSIKGKTKVSHLANKKIKSLLSQCAVNAISFNVEMKKYYERRVAEGKPAMSVINTIRNKLLARIFAVVERKTPYVNTYKFAS